MPTLLSAPALLVRSLHHHLIPMSHHHIHHHFEDGGENPAPLRHPPKSPEILPVIPPAFATILRQTQYVLKIQQTQGPMPQTSRMNGHLDLSKASAKWNQGRFLALLERHTVIV